MSEKDTDTAAVVVEVIKMLLPLSQSERLRVIAAVQIYFQHMNEPGGHPINHDEKAREILRATAEYVGNRKRCSSKTMCMLTGATWQELLAAKLKELYGEVPDDNGWYCPHCRRAVPWNEATYKETHTECGTPLGVAPPNPKVPESLEAAINEAYERYWKDYGDANWMRHKIVDYIVPAVARFCQKSEVPKDLEAAVRRVLADNFRNHKLYGKETINRLTHEIVSAVAPLLAEKDNEIQVLRTELNDWESSNYERVIADQKKRIKELEYLINEVSETLAPLQISHRHLYPWGWLNKARVYFGKPPVEESPDED